MTQGIVSVVNKAGSTLRKIIVGDNGMNAEDLAKAIGRATRPLSAEHLYAMALEADFGCEDCLVVQDRERDFHGPVIEELPAVYREKFDDPRWNPRWRHGTADHTVVVEVDWAS